MMVCLFALVMANVESPLLLKCHSLSGKSPLKTVEIKLQRTKEGDGKLKRSVILKEKNIALFHFI